MLQNAVESMLSWEDSFVYALGGSVGDGHGGPRLRRFTRLAPFSCLPVPPPPESRI
jgi:hypothetical protein